jgi:arylformamidase
MRFHDITRPITSDMPIYPGDPPTVIERVQDIARGNPFTLSAVSFSSHAGTHIDAPSHLVEGGLTVDEIPLDVLVGDVVVVEVSKELGVYSNELERLSIPRRTRRLLVKTPENTESFLTMNVARWLIDVGVELLGIDGQSVDEAGSENLIVHRTLLEAGVVIVENLDLSKVQPGNYLLVCLPMKLAGLDGAPVRAVLIED